MNLNARKEPGTKSILETASHVAVLLASVAIIAALSWGYFAQHASIQLKSGLHRGEVLSIPKIDLAASDRTLLIALSTTCRFCSSSTSFYNRLAQTVASTRSRTAIRAVFSEDRSLVDRFVQQNGIDPQIVTMEKFDVEALNVNSTPTLVLVDGKGRILDFWVGQLSKEGEQQVLSKIGAAD